MNFYDKLVNNINIFFNSDIYKKLITKTNDTSIISLQFEGIYNYPSEISELIIQDNKFFISIIDRYKKLIIGSSSFNKVLKYINKPLLNNLDSEIKIKYNNFNEIIKQFLINENWFYNLYNELQPISIDNESNESLLEFNWRPNQKEAIDNLYRDGLVTGIHCQATGTGKSYIILKYIEYMYKQNTNCKIILFTERVNILKDLFDFNNNKVNNDKINEWLQLGICDLTQFDIINRVTIKKTDWIDILNNASKPTLLVINRAYLTLKNNYKKINNLDLIIPDECHMSSSNLCYDFLMYWKNKHVPIIGFSATPLRSGKTDGEYNIEKLIDIFSNENNENEKRKLKLLTDYNMIYSIQQNLILPPKFYWYNMETYQTKNDNVHVSPEEVGSVLNIVNDIIHGLPNKKIIAWCGTINLCKNWYKLFNEYKERYKLIVPEIYKLETFIDISTNKNDDYEIFKNKQEFSILFCAQKHREGSDIKYLDCCLFLDKVKNRGSIPFIQSIGRVLRNGYNKCCGIIIDGVVKDNEYYDKIFTDKILGYYFALSNLSCDDTENKYEQYVKLRDVVNFDKENKIINMKLQNINISINCKKLDWSNIVSKFQILLEKKLNLTPEEAFEMIIKKIKTIDAFNNPLNDFWKEYNKLDHQLLGIPPDIYETYPQIWSIKTWYDVLGLKYYNYDKFKTFIISHNIKTIKKYHKIIKNNIDYPYYPEEYYRLTGWSGWKINIINNNDIF